MTLSTLSITRTLASPDSLWGNTRQLVVIVTSCTYQGQGFLLAYGVDPARVTSQLDALVFERMLPLGGLADFLSVLLDGGPDEQRSDKVDTDPVLSKLAKQSGGRVIANSVDVPNADPPPPGPKLTVVFALASSIASDQSLAEVAAYAA